MQTEIITRRLYESDGHLSTFTAHILACEQAEKGYAITLDRTAFFPEGGGQSADTGMMGEARVIDVQEKNEAILHFVDRPLAVGAEVACSLDYEQRFSRMQNHTGEHIVSGIIYRLFGFSNVGFHLGSEDVTLDIDGELTRADLDRVEAIANRAVWENRPVTCGYPSAKELAQMSYRSKLELTENVRIVTVEGYDVCACCAPHVSATGEIGVIKLLDFLRYKGGTRIHMLCGASALADYGKKYQNACRISNTLSVKQNEVAEGVMRMADELFGAQRALGEAKRQILTLRGKTMPFSEGNLCFFESDTDPVFLRELANLGADHCGGICTVFFGRDGGYRYFAASRHLDLRPFAKRLHASCNGRGGGSAELVQGSVSTTRKELEAFLASDKEA